MVEIKILEKGDEVLGINEQFLAIKRKNGMVDIYTVMFSEDGEVLVDPIKKTTIGYGTGIVSKELDDGETTISMF